jgi:hypothetical protein
VRGACGWEVTSHLCESHSVVRDEVLQVREQRRRRVLSEGPAKVGGGVADKLARGVGGGVGKKRLMGAQGEGQGWATGGGGLGQKCGRGGRKEGEAEQGGGEQGGGKWLSQVEDFVGKEGEAMPTHSVLFLHVRVNVGAGACQRSSVWVQIAGLWRMV